MQADWRSARSRTGDPTTGFARGSCSRSPTCAGACSDSVPARCARTSGRAGEGAEPKYLNTSDNTVYHKGAHLYGAHLARAHAARAGQTILCEGYTDVIALHQAGMRNAVGLMGTALTPEQVGGLVRMAPTVLLALDADSAGQEAMLRAATLASRRKLELRVVPLPAGTDPADLLQREGAAAIERTIEASVPFVRFRVQRVLDSGDHGSPEGRDKMLDELRPVFATLAPSALRMELTRLVSERLDLPESLAERTLAARGGAGNEPTSSAPGESGGRSRTPRAAVVSRGESTERAFLAQCIVEPEAGAQALAELDPAEHFTSDVLRRAALHLREHLATPRYGPARRGPRAGGAAGRAGGAGRPGVTPARDARVPTHAAGARAPGPSYPGRACAGQW